MVEKFAERFKTICDEVEKLMRQVDKYSKGNLTGDEMVSHIHEAIFGAYATECQWWSKYVSDGENHIKDRATGALVDGDSLHKTGEHLLQQIEAKVRW